MRGATRDDRRPLVALAALVVLALVGGVIGGSIAWPGPGHGDRPGPSTGPSGGADPATTSPPVPGHELYGFVPYWEMDATIATHLAATPLTTVALFSVTATADGSIATKERGYRAIDGALGRRIARDAHARGVRVELTFTSFGADRNRRLFDDPAVQDRWIATLVAYVGERGFDGVNVDVEGLPLDLVGAYGSFVGRLRDALRVADPRAELSVATGGHVLGAAMAAAAAQAGADRIFLMGYDYRTADSEPGATAPLVRSDGEGGDLTTSLELYAALGVPVDRTLLGLPLYGMSWPAVSADPGAASTGPGDVWIPRRNLDVLRTPTFSPTLVPDESVEFASQGRVGAYTAIYFDSPRSLRPKLTLANERGLAGAGFWAIGYERGIEGFDELMADFRAGR